MEGAATPLMWLGNGWPPAVSVAVATVTMYVVSLIALRVAGRRTVARMSAFDFVVTVAMGSIIATTVVKGADSLLNGVTAILVMLALQMAVGVLRQKSAIIRRLVDFSPRVLYENGHLDLPTSVFGAQPTKDEIESKLRQSGVTDWAPVEKVVLEPDGTVSVILDKSATSRHRDE